MQDGACDFKGIYSDTSERAKASNLNVDGGKKAYFPIEVFHKAGAVVKADAWLEKLYRPAELENGMAICREGFQVVVLSHFELEGDFSYKEFLFESGTMPDFNLFQVVNIKA